MDRVEKSGGLGEIGRFGWCGMVLGWGWSRLGADEGERDGLPGKWVWLICIGRVTLRLRIGMVRQDSGGWCGEVAIAVGAVELVWTPRGEDAVAMRAVDGAGGLDGELACELGVGKRGGLRLCVCGLGRGSGGSIPRPRSARPARALNRPHTIHLHPLMRANITVPNLTPDHTHINHL
jgi:hypothetical protein